MDEIEKLKSRIRELEAASLRDAVDYEAALERERRSMELHLEKVNAHVQSVEAELERRTTWSNEQITKRDAELRERDAEISRLKAISPAQPAAAAEDVQPPLFEGEPEHCGMCGEPGHTHDDHWLFSEIERIGLSAFERHVSDEALSKECVRRGWGVIKPKKD